MQPDHFAYEWDIETVKKIQPFKTFEDFCLNFTDFQEPSCSSSIPEHQVRKFHFFSQSKWTHHNNKPFVDFTGRIESLQSDLQKLESLLNADNCPELKGEWDLQLTRLRHENSSPHGRYTNYYNTKSIEAVAEIYKDDILNFNYEFQ